MAGCLMIPLHLGSGMCRLQALAILHEYSRAPCLSGRLSRFHLFRLLMDNPDTCSPGTPSAKSLHCSWRDFFYFISP
ncbi:hypothetical protein AMECASPLE_011604 [Ameca splendens]|uniref:Secreted protein n=1 Tax=Ameca splendens TaxID=208324 RepID=A0ABV0XPY0_9TELE